MNKKTSTLAPVFAALVLSSCSSYGTHTNGSGNHYDDPYSNGGINGGDGYWDYGFENDPRTKTPPDSNNLNSDWYYDTSKEYREWMEQQGYLYQ